MDDICVVDFDRPVWRLLNSVVLWLGKTARKGCDFEADNYGLAALVADSGPRPISMIHGSLLVVASL